MNETECNNKIIKKLASTFGIYDSFTLLYHPQANLLKRTNRVPGNNDKVYY